MTAVVAAAAFRRVALARASQTSAKAAAAVVVPTIAASTTPSLSDVTEPALRHRRRYESVRLSSTRINDHATPSPSSRSSLATVLAPMALTATSPSPSPSPSPSLSSPWHAHHQCYTTSSLLPKGEGNENDNSQLHEMLSSIPHAIIDDAAAARQNARDDNAPKLDLTGVSKPVETIMTSLLPSSSQSSDIPGSRAFVECDREALIDLFHKYAVECDIEGQALDKDGLRSILKAVGENPDEATLQKLFAMADVSGDGFIELEEFLISSDIILGDAPASIVLVVGGPGSGKGLLSKRLETECGVVHLSSGDLLRDEVRRGTVLGRQVQDIMSRGELVSSAVIVTLIRRVMRNHPGKRVLLDGFPRSLQNAHDLVTLCGKPELALHLECDDTILMERILKRAEETAPKNDSNKASLTDPDAVAAATSALAPEKRSDDNIHTALKRLRTYHKYHHPTMQWLREQHIPVVNLDCSGTPADVWEQLVAIGRLMRPAARISSAAQDAASSVAQTKERGSGVVAGTNVVVSGAKVGVVNAEGQTTTVTTITTSTTITTADAALNADRKAA